jgi:2-aminoethylphosphonate-pyruvate transaminase
MPGAHPFDPAQIAAYLTHHKIDRGDGASRDVFGMLNPLAEIGTLAKAVGALFVVDGVSSVGAEVSDRHGGFAISRLTSSSSKAIGSYPTRPSVGRKKHSKAERSCSQRQPYHLNLATFYAFLKHHSQTPNTPAVPLFLPGTGSDGHPSIGVMKRYARIKARADLLREGMRT